MSVDYTIKAIPTMYLGRRYRSRLEARWAAFFDIIGWNYEYEPRDFGKWSPDFALWGIRQNTPVMVEVKPITAWDRDVARKMADATYDESPFLLLLGNSPEIQSTACAIGWFAQPNVYEARWTEAIIGNDASGRIDMIPNSDDFCLSGILWEGEEGFQPADCKAAWTKAANVIQWIAGARS
jgi:hypothetical protein